MFSRVGGVAPPPPAGAAAALAGASASAGAASAFSSLAAGAAFPAAGMSDFAGSWALTRPFPLNASHTRTPPSRLKRTHVLSILSPVRDGRS